MSSKNYCDRTLCGKEITGVPFRITLPGHKQMDLCESCKGELLQWFNKTEVDELPLTI